MTVEQVLLNITDASKWFNEKALISMMSESGNLRGMNYGYTSEYHFADYLNQLGISEHFKPRETNHGKSAVKAKSDRTFKFKERYVSVQLKSPRTETIRALDTGFLSRIECSTSDKHVYNLPNGTNLSCRCVLVDAFDVLAVSLQPFTGNWQSFAFKKAKDLPLTTDKNVPQECRQYFLSRYHVMHFPNLTDGWTTDLLTLVDDPELSIRISQPKEASLFD